MRRAFFEEFKIHSFNYIMLLFESVNRMIANDEKDESQLIDEEKHARQIGNYKQASDLAKDRKTTTTFTSKSGNTIEIKEDENEQEKVQYYSKNYKKYIEHRQQPLKKYVANCIGWIHIVRAVEVLAMGIRDLCNKIIPVVLEERVLKTLNGKVLSF